MSETYRSCSKCGGSTLLYRLRPRSNSGAYHCCPRCGCSKFIRIKRSRVEKLSGIKAKYRCRECREKLEIRQKILPYDNEGRLAPSV